MSFLFASSHLPVVKRPEEDEEEHNVQPMRWSGSVRAFSHLPVKRAAGDHAGASSPRRGIVPIPPRAAAPTGPEPSPLGDQDDPPPPEADADPAHEPNADTSPHEPEVSRPWYMPRISAKDLPAQDQVEDETAPSLNPPTSNPWENPARSPGSDYTYHAARSAACPRANGLPLAPQAPAQNNTPALPYGRLFEKRSTPDAFFMQQHGKGASRPSGPSPQQRLQESQRSTVAPQQVPESNPPTQSSKPAAQSQAVSPYEGQAPDKIEEGRVTSSKEISEVGETPALRPLRPGRSTDPGAQYSIELDKTEAQMRDLLLARRAVYDKLKNGNMPLSTDELTRLMELDYQRGLRANGTPEGMTFMDLTNVADDAYFYHIEPNRMNHPGYEGFRGSGFALVESPEPQFDNPHIKRMARGYSDPYFGWEINYNVVGQWLRISGYSRPEAMHFLAAWLGASPTKWGSLNLDRKTWFLAGYDYADARQKGWNPTGQAPEAKSGNYGWMAPPPASHPPARATERSRHY